VSALPLPVHRAVLFVDVEGFGDRRRTHPHQVAVRRGVYGALTRAFARAGVRLEDCYHEDRGDGVLVLVPSEVPKNLLVTDVPPELAAALAEHNEAHEIPARIRLRLAVHAGEIQHDDHGVAGTAITVACRLLEAEPVKRALAGSGGVLALIASDWFFAEVIRHTSARDDYRRVRVSVKGTRDAAWICLPDDSRPPGGRAQPRPAPWAAFAAASVAAYAGRRPDAIAGVLRGLVTAPHMARVVTRAHRGVTSVPPPSRSGGRLRAAPPFRPGAMLPSAQHAELLERDRELHKLDALVRAAGQGAGRLAVVAGPAGIGKTHLLAAARTGAGRAGMRVLSARGSELEREFAYGMARQLFEPVLAQASPGERAELLAGGARQAAPLFGSIGVSTAAPGPDSSITTLHGLFWLTAKLSRQAPLMLAVDDLHWSDRPSLRFLAHLLPRLQGLPLLVLAGLRPTERDADRDLLAQLTTDPLVETVRLAPLSQPASARLVRAVLAREADDAFCAACHTASGGNPLLLRELADMAAFENLEPTAAGAAHLVALGPRVVGQRVALRLERLGPAAVALCRAVAIFGDGANVAHAAALAGLDPADAVQLARRLSDMEILRWRALAASGAPWAAATAGAAPALTVGFVHPLVLAAVYDGLQESERLALHAHAARLLAQAGASAEQIAAHLLLVPPGSDGVPVGALRRAAHEAVTRGSPEGALAYLERCLAEPLPDAQRAEVLLQLGHAARVVDMTKTIEYLSAALALIREPERRAVTAEMLGRALFLAGRDGEAVAVYSRAANDLSVEHASLGRQLEAGLLQVALANPALWPTL